MTQKMIIIGVMEDSRDINTFNRLKEILSISNYKVFYENRIGNIIMLNCESESIMIIDIKPNIVNSIRKMGIDFNIVIHTFLKDFDYENGDIRDILKNSNHIIINCDEEKWTSLLGDNRKSIVTTYGFNSKASINPSSYNIHDTIQSNVCFQREILTIMGNSIEPFEISMKMNSRNKSELYSSIAAMTCCLILGVNISLMSELIEFNGIHMR